MSDPDVVVYSHGLCYASACAPLALGPEAVTVAVNVALPTGIESRWSVSSEDFLNGPPNPCPCETDAGRRHWLLSC